MKIKRLAGLITLAPLALMCACSSTQALNFSANWYPQTDTLSTVRTGVSEVLTYSMSFTPDAGASLVLDYQNGVYTTTLSGETYDAGERNLNVYHLHTELSVNVSFSLNGVTAGPFEDSVVSDVYFLSVVDGLRPIESTKVIHSTTPLTSNPSSLQKDIAYHTFDLAYQIKYDDALEKAYMKVDYLDTDADDNNAPTEINIKGKGTFLDNEQILFAMRGLNMTAASFRTVDTAAQKLQSAALTGISAPTDYTANFAVGDGEATERTLSAYSATLSYQGNNPGQAQELTYASVTNPNNNEWRSVLLRMEVPLLQAVGKMTYTLIRADFK